MFERLRELFQAWRGHDQARIECDDDGFALKQGRSETVVLWQDIETIHAFKRDLVTIDQICLSVLASGRAITLHEEMEGYDNLLAQLETKLGVGPEWMLDVMFPAFESNLTEIFPISNARDQ